MDKIDIFDNCEKYFIASGHNSTDTVILLEDAKEAFNNYCIGINSDDEVKIKLHPDFNTPKLDETLKDAWVILFGKQWKSNWPVKAKADEMRSIIMGGDMPCRPFISWVMCINHLQEKHIFIKQK